MSAKRDILNLLDRDKEEIINKIQEKIIILQNKASSLEEKIENKILLNLKKEEIFYTKFINDLIKEYNKQNKSNFSYKKYKNNNIIEINPNWNIIVDTKKYIDLINNIRKEFEITRRNILLTDIPTEYKNFLDNFSKECGKLIINL